MPKSPQKLLESHVFPCQYNFTNTRCLPARFDGEFLFENIDEERFQGTEKIKTSAKFEFHMER